MTAPLKITVIGGGSTYTPELIKGFLELHPQLPLTDLWLMDIQPQRLEIVGDFCERVVTHAGAPFRVHVTDNQREAIDGAQYVITQLRVGFNQARREDEYLGRRHGLIGQETTGVGGMAKALRTIPVILRVAADMRELSPDALLVNFTNPSGLIIEMLSRHAAGVAAVGLCNSPITTKMGILSRYKAHHGVEIDPQRAELDALGLNHLSWYRGFRIDGQDIWDEIIEDYISDLQASPHPEWPAEMISSLRMMPNSYIQYYLDTPAKLAAQASWPPSRAEQVMEIEKVLLDEYSDPRQVTTPADLMKRGGAYYSTLATQVINSHYNNLGLIEIVNVRQNGAVPGVPTDWVMELPCRIDRKGIHPMQVDPLPAAALGLTSIVKAYEILTAQAGALGDRDAAYQALLIHPLGPEAARVRTVLDDLLHTNRRYLPQFFER